MLISHILNAKGATVHTIGADGTLLDAARELQLRKVGAVIVTSPTGALEGVLSERDIVRAIASRGPQALTERVEQVMTKAVITAAANETVDEGLTRMTDRRIRHLPVVEGQRLVGVVSIGDLVKHKIEAAEAEAEAMRAYITAG